MGRQVLTIDMLEPDRDFIAINKQPYYLRMDIELSLTQIAKIRRLSKAVMEHGITEDSTEDDVLRVEAFANEVLAIVVIDLPEDVRDKLSTLHKFQIVQAFMTVASSKRAGTVTGENGKGSQLITGGLSPGSGVSTEATSPTI